MTDWDKMPVAQKSSLIRMFVENGITDVNKMRHIYANGGVMEEPDTQDIMQEPQQDTLPGDYGQWMNSMALKLSEMSGNSYIFTLCDIADNRDFDYSGMYNDNPQYAWSLLDDNNPDFYELGKMIYGEPEPVVEEIEQISDTEGDIIQNEYADGGELEHPVPPEYNDMARVLTERYKNLNFVQRALNPDDYPYIENENGDRVTHLMEVSDDGAGNYFIYPTVVQQDTNSDLEVLDGDDAFSHAMRTGEYITVPNKDFAIWYSNNGLIDHLHDSEGNEYAEGGKIHIKKENRGKFTEAAKRAGKSVQEYARQILANKGNYSPTLVKRANFARNASKWHDDGGPLNGGKRPKFREFKNAWEDTIEDFGIDGIQGAKGLRRAYRKDPQTQWRNLETTRQIYENLANSSVQSPSLETHLSNLQENNNIPLDYGLNPYSQTKELARQSALDEYNWYMNNTTPEQRAINRIANREDYQGLGKFAAGIAASPLMFTGIGNADKFIKGLYGFMTNPFVDAAFTVHGGLTAPSNIKEGINDVKSGKTLKGLSNIGLTALDFVGAGELGVRGARMLNRAYRAKHAYNAIDPAGYNNVTDRAKSWLKSMWYNPQIDIENPQWLQKLKKEKNVVDGDSIGYTNTQNYLPAGTKHAGKIADEARMDAWALYNGLPQPFGTYIKNADGTYSYNMPKVLDLSEGTWHIPEIPQDVGVEKQGDVWDFVTGAGGGLTDFRLLAKDDVGNGLLRIEDTWDLHPFSREDDDIFNRLINRNRTNNLKLAQWLYKKSQGDFAKRMNNRLKNFEVGSISGGKPFKMVTDIPFHNVLNTVEYKQKLAQLEYEKANAESIADRIAAGWKIRQEPMFKYGYNPDYNYPSWRIKDDFPDFDKNTDIKSLFE